MELKPMKELRKAPALGIHGPVLIKNVTNGETQWVVTCGTETLPNDVGWIEIDLLGLKDPIIPNPVYWGDRVLEARPGESRARPGTMPESYSEEWMIVRGKITDQMLIVQYAADEDQDLYHVLVSSVEYHGKPVTGYIHGERK